MNKSFYKKEAEKVQNLLSSLPSDEQKDLSNLENIDAKKNGNEFLTCLVVLCLIIISMIVLQTIWLVN